MVDELRYLAGFVRGGLAPLLRQALGEATLADVLARWARASPGAPALQVGEHLLDAAELVRASRGAAEFLARQGARSGDVVALVGRNSVAYVALLLGAAQSGVTLALVHPELSGEPLRHALAAAHAERIVCEQALAASIASSSELPQAAFDAEARQPFGWSGVGPGFDPARKSRDLALVYTSGTTGLPKACRLPHTRVLAAAAAFFR